MIGIATLLMLFRPFEIGQQFGIAPAAGTRLRPVIVIAGMATDIDHAVDRRGTAQHPATRMSKAAIIEMRFRFRLVGPVEARRGQELPHARGHLNGPVLIHRASFQQQHPAIGVFRQPGRQHAAGRPRADNDVIVLGGLAHVRTLNLPTLKAGSRRSRACGSDAPDVRSDCSPRHRSDSGPGRNRRNAGPSGC